MTFRISLLLAVFSLSATAMAGDALKTAIAENLKVPREFRLDGVVEAVHQSTISAQTQGQVQEILFDVDDFVEKGAIVVRLKDTEQRARYSRAEADLKVAQAQRQEAVDEHDRTRDLFGKQLVSESAMDKASAGLKAAVARHEAASAGLDQAREQLEYTRVRAPYSGIVTRRHLEVGETANTGQKLMSGISLDRLRVTVDVPQSLMPAVRSISRARVEQPGNGYIEAEKLTIFPYADPGSNTFKVRLDLPEGSAALFPGMFVKTAFVIGERRVLMIPSESVAHRSEVTGVYVVRPDGRVGFRHVRLGNSYAAGMVSVLSGLERDESVALDPIAAGTLLKQQRVGQEND